MAAEQYSFIAPLEFLKIDGRLGSEWTIAADLKLSTSITIAKKIVNSPLTRQIGEIEANTILDGSPFLFTTSDYPLEDSSCEAQMNLLNARLQIAITLCNLLWLLKDNSVNFGQGVLQYPYERSGSPSRISTNSWIAKYHTADGELKVTKFTKAELRKAISMHRSLYGSMASDNISVGLTPGTAGRIDRLSRAFFFLQGARAMRDLPQKVANYCICFEALVSTSHTEIIHQVAERVAILIGEDSADALEIYRNIKKAYDTRSKLLHGAELRPNQDQYKTQSINCDNYLRRLLYVVITMKDVAQALAGDQEVVNQFFLEELLHVTR